MFTGVLKRYLPGHVGAAPARGSLLLDSGHCWRLVVWVATGEMALPVWPALDAGKSPSPPATGSALGRVAHLARGRSHFPVCRDQRASGLLGSGTSVLHRR